MLTDERTTSAPEVDPAPPSLVAWPDPPIDLTVAREPLRAVGRRDPHAVSALLAVLTVGLGSLLAIVALWWTVV